jgi:hypothetical protein
LLEVSLSGNKLPYFCIDALVNSIHLPQGVRLSDTKIDDLSAYSLVSQIVKSSASKNPIGVCQLDLSANPLLSYPFYKQLLILIKSSAPSSIKTIDLRKCSIEEAYLIKLGKNVTLAHAGGIARSSKNLLNAQVKTGNRDVSNKSLSRKSSKMKVSEPTNQYSTSNFLTID